MISFSIIISEKDKKNLFKKIEEEFLVDFHKSDFECYIAINNFEHYTISYGYNNIKFTFFGEKSESFLQKVRYYISSFFKGKTIGLKFHTTNLGTELLGINDVKTIVI